VGTKWGVYRTPIDLLNCSAPTSKKAVSLANVMVLLSWFSKAPGQRKFRYDGTDAQWILVDMVISIVVM
jgi:hypothetical protein